jgi:hypothetical protein
MWTLTGPFDGEVAGELAFQSKLKRCYRNVLANPCAETKLLKTGTSYPLGRKGTGLVISSKKISSNHCEFVVGPYTINDVVSPDSVC